MTQIPKVRNMITVNGTVVPNQFVITTQDGQYFQSYNSVVAFRPVSGAITLGPSWKYSATTSKYRAQFLNETTAETQAKLDAGIYLLSTDLD